MLLAIDVGNTNIVLGVFDGQSLVQAWRLQTVRERTSDELGLLVDGLFAHSKLERVQVRGVILGSVVPPLTGTILTMIERYFGVKAMGVEPGVNTGMPILYENPSEAAPTGSSTASPRGSDSAAGGRPMIVVDFGTATTP
jgi:type III pantothenate kinase